MLNFCSWNLLWNWKIIPSCPCYDNFLLKIFLRKYVSGISRRRPLAKRHVFGSDVDTDHTDLTIILDLYNVFLLLKKWDRFCKKDNKIAIYNSSEMSQFVVFEKQIFGDITFFSSNLLIWYKLLRINKVILT